MTSIRMLPDRRRVLAGAAATAASIAMPAIVRAQRGPLKSASCCRARACRP